jgi:hypothetical protein
MLPATLASVLKEIRSYSATEWELFVEEWLRGLQKKYSEVKRLGASGDLGRDVVAFTDAQKLDGVWDNYQCKHLDRPMLASSAGPEIAKTLYYIFKKKFHAPRTMLFVAPRDVSTELSDLLNSPTKLKAYVQAHWDSGYAGSITDSGTVPLQGDLADFVEGFDFSIFGYYQTSQVIEDHRQTAHWSERFGGLLPAPPSGVVPTQIQPSESAYLGQLLDVYGEKNGCTFNNCDEVATEADLAADLKLQRERFFQAEAFGRYYRDETEPGTVEHFVEDVFDAIDPIAKLQHPRGYDRLNSCLSQAAQVNAGGILAPHARPKTKQGVCHQLANADRIYWMVK